MPVSHQRLVDKSAFCFKVPSARDCIIHRGGTNHGYSLINADIRLALPAGLATATLAQDVKPKNDVKPATPGTLN